MKWQCRSQIARSRESLTDAIEDLGAEGWELVSAAYIPQSVETVAGNYTTTTHAHWIAWLKRPVPPPGAPPGAPPHD